MNTSMKAVAKLRISGRISSSATISMSFPASLRTANSSLVPSSVDRTAMRWPGIWSKIGNWNRKPKPLAAQACCRQCSKPNSCSACRSSASSSSTVSRSVLSLCPGRPSFDRGLQNGGVLHLCGRHMRVSLPVFLASPAA
jgi:hypothetical protein